MSYLKILRDKYLNEAAADGAASGSGGSQNGATDNTNGTSSEAQGNQGTALTGDSGTTEGNAPADGASGDGTALTGDGGTSDEPKGAPEQYEQFNIPEGLSLEGEQLEGFTAFAKEAGMTQKQAQAAIDMHSKIVTDMIAAHNEQQQTTMKEWLDAAKSDKQYGGDRFNENMGIAKRALETFGDEGLTQVLNETGLGNHPDVIRFFFNIGKQLSEDRSLVTGKPGGQKDNRPIENRLYPNEATK